MFAAVVLLPNPYFKTHPDTQEYYVNATFTGETAQEAATNADDFRDGHLKNNKSVRILTGEMTHEVKIPVKEFELTAVKKQ